MSAHFSEIYFRIMEDIEAERTFNTLRRMDFFQLLEIITEPWHSVNPDREDLYAKMIKLFSEELSLQQLAVISRLRAKPSVLQVIFAI